MKLLRPHLGAVVLFFRCRESRCLSLPIGDGAEICKSLVKMLQLVKVFTLGSRRTSRLSQVILMEQSSGASCCLSCARRIPRNISKLAHYDFNAFIAITLAEVLGAGHVTARPLPAFPSNAAKKEHVAGSPNFSAKWWNGCGRPLARNLSCDKEVGEKKRRAWWRDVRIVSPTLMPTVSLPHRPRALFTTAFCTQTAA